MIVKGHSPKVGEDLFFDVVIIGAGPGGLTLACYLANRGIRVLLSDRRSGMAPVGRGELIQPLGIGILKDLNLLDSLLQEEHVRYEEFHFLKMTGELLMKTVYSSAALSFPWAISIDPYYQDRLMWNALKDSEFVTVWPESRYVSHEDHGRETVVQMDSHGLCSKIKCRLIVGDDGRESMVRSSLNLPGKVTEYRDSYLSWSFELPPGHLTDSPAMNPAARYFLGPGEIFFLFATSERKRCFLYMVKDRDLEGLIKKGDAFFLARLDQCIPGLRSVLLESGFPGVSSLKEWVVKKVDFDKWSRGNGVVIGDAAHGMNPHVAQGRNQAMEDGRLLSQFIVEGLKRQETEWTMILNQFELLRIPRAKELHALAEEMCMVWNSSNPFVVWGRECVFKGMSKIPRLQEKVVKTISGEDFIPLTHGDRIKAFLKGALV